MPRRSTFLLALRAALGARGVCLVDVGARGGLQPRWRELADLLDVVAFEPDAEEASRLQATFAGARSAIVVPAAVWADDDERTLHLTRSAGCSSLFEPDGEVLRSFPDPDRWEVTSDVPLRTTTLDRALASVSAPPADFLKIDVQGGALPVLEGGAATLGSVAGVEVEVELLSLYRGEPLFGEVDAFLRAAGFELIDLRPTYWRRRTTQHVAGTKGQIAFADALYFVRPEVLAERAPDAALAAVAGASIYGLYDRVVLYAGDREGPMGDLARLAARPSTIGRIPEFRYRYLVGHLLKDAGDALLTSRRTWAVAEQHLGNRPRHPRFPWR